MGLLDGQLAGVFGAAFAALFRDGVLHKTAETDIGGGAFAVAATDIPVKLSLDALGASGRAASGLPLSAMRMTLLRAGLAVTVDLDDGITLGGASYRIVKVDTDPAGAAFGIAVVPA